MTIKGSPDRHLHLGMEEMGDATLFVAREERRLAMLVLTVPPSSSEGELYDEDGFVARVDGDELVSLEAKGHPFAPAHPIEGERVYTFDRDLEEQVLKVYG
jgi:hypothetical protein